MLHTSNRLETLAESLAETLRRPLGCPLQPEVVMVQSQGMARWLKLQLAGRHGVCANYSFPFPRIFCAEVLVTNASGAPTSSRLTATDNPAGELQAKSTLSRLKVGAPPKAGEQAALNREVMVWEIMRVLPEMLG